MQLFYIRHAESTNNYLYSKTGSDKGRAIDPEITSRGEKQVEYLARYLARKKFAKQKSSDPLNLKSFGITHIYSSPMIRALMTAQGISRHTGVKVNVWVNLHEVGGIVEKNETTGEYEGRPGNPRHVLVERFPEFHFPEEITENGWWNRPFEPEENRVSRALSVFGEVLARHNNTDDRVILVSHAAFYSYLIKVIMKANEETLFLSLANTGITRVDIESTYRVIRYMNRFDFLPKDLVTA